MVRAIHNGVNVKENCVHYVRGMAERSEELENVLMLGDDVENKTVPVILCSEENVVGNHGATKMCIRDRTRPMCFWQLDCRMRLHTEVFV